MQIRILSISAIIALTASNVSAHQSVRVECDHRISFGATTENTGNVTITRIIPAYHKIIVPCSKDANLNLNISVGEGDSITVKQYQHQKQKQ